jgi:methionyl-tRNA formyltransferase
MGTPEFAVASLQAILESKHQVVAVVTAPDKPAGRGMKIRYSPVKETALQYNLPVLQPLNLKHPEFLEQLKSFQADLFVVVAFRMLPAEVWKMPPKGTVNLHASLLPQYRGAAPINWAIINNEKYTGVTTFFIQENIDTGNILFSEKVPIEETECAGELHDKLKTIGARLLIKTVDAIENNSITPIPQDMIDVEGLKYAPKIYKDTCKINWSRSVNEIYNLIRGLSPSPGAFSYLHDGETRLLTKIFKASCQQEVHSFPTGTIISDNKTYLKVACTGGFIQVELIQIEGKSRLPITEFLKGFKNISTCHFES